jgi:hypothetical protein
MRGIRRVAESLAVRAELGSLGAPSGETAGNAWSWAELSEQGLRRASLIDCGIASAVRRRRGGGHRGDELPDSLICSAAPESSAERSSLRAWLKVMARAVVVTMDGVPPSRRVAATPGPGVRGAAGRRRTAGYAPWSTRPDRGRRAHGRPGTRPARWPRGGRRRRCCRFAGTTGIAAGQPGSPTAARAATCPEQIVNVPSRRGPHTITAADLVPGGLHQALEAVNGTRGLAH